MKPSHPSEEKAMTPAHTALVQSIFIARAFLPVLPALGQPT
jgi:hypothetical protein